MHKALIFASPFHFCWFDCFPPITNTAGAHSSCSIVLAAAKGKGRPSAQIRAYARIQQQSRHFNH